MMHIIACCESMTRVFSYGRFLSRVFKDSNIDLSRKMDFEAPSIYDTYDDDFIGQMKFEKAPDYSWVRKAERTQAHAQEQPRGQG